MSSLVTDINARKNILLITIRAIGIINFEKLFLKFYRRHFELVSKFKVGLKSLLQQGLSEPEFYGDLVYKLRKIVSRLILLINAENVSCLTKVLDLISM